MNSIPHVEMRFKALLVSVRAVALSLRAKRRTLRAQRQIQKWAGKQRLAMTSMGSPDILLTPLCYHTTKRTEKRYRFGQIGNVLWRIWCASGTSRTVTHGTGARRCTMSAPVSGAALPASTKRWPFCGRSWSGYPMKDWPTLRKVAGRSSRSCAQPGRRRLAAARQGLQRR